MRSSSITNRRTGRFFKDTRGANLVEYIILVGVIALLALAGFKTFGKNVRERVDKQASDVSGIGK